jgi:hypothetical protein
MGLRFTRRVRIAPGLRVNFSKSGASLSIGHREERRRPERGLSCRPLAL